MQSGLLPCHRPAMQRLACSCPPRLLLASRSPAFSSSVAARAAAGATIDAEVIGQGAPAEKPSVKARIQGVLASLDKPVSSGELWELCQDKDVRSKRFMKVMLQQMRKDRRVMTRPGPRGKAYGYILPANFEALKQKVSDQILASASVDDLPASQL